jgi:hypothetical protein
MTDTGQLREAITGLLGLALTEEEILLGRYRDGGGSAANWATVPLVGHNTDFKDQQVQRVRAMRSGVAPPVFAEIDHRSPEVYAALAGRTAGEVTAAVRAATAALIDGVLSLDDQVLLGAGANGRLFWLQVIMPGRVLAPDRACRRVLHVAWAGQAGGGAAVARRGYRAVPGCALAGNWDGGLRPGVRPGPRG